MTVRAQLVSIGTTFVVFATTVFSVYIWATAPLGDPTQIWTRGPLSVVALGSAHLALRLLGQVHREEVHFVPLPNRINGSRWQMKAILYIIVFVSVVSNVLFSVSLVLPPL